MKAWIKGGLIGWAVFILLVIFSFYEGGGILITALPFFIFIVVVSIPFRIFEALGLSEGKLIQGFMTGDYSTLGLIIFIIPAFFSTLIIGFGIGAIIGLIVGKVKAHKDTQVLANKTVRFIQKG